MKITSICLAAVLSLPVFLRAQAPASITVDASFSPGPVNRLVFGQNVEAADSARIFSSDTTNLNLIEAGSGYWDPDKGAPDPLVLERAREIGVSLLRYPGGSYVHNYNWLKAVGPLEARGNWKFGIDEYLALCKTLGAEPMFTVSDYVLPADQMPANAAGLVEYLNAPATPDHPWAMKRKEWGHPEPYGVKWFELGNESDEGNNRVLPRRHYSPEEYAAYANATAAAMRAVDPSIKLGIVTEPGPGIDARCKWNRTVVHLAGQSADFLIVHLYGPVVGTNTSEPDFFQALMAVGEQSARHLDDFETMALEECGRSLPVAITEFNGPISPDKKAYFFSYVMALECADLQRIYLQPEHHVLAASYWQFLNGPFGMLQHARNAPDGGMAEEKPMFALERLWAGHLGTRLATVRVNGPTATFAGAGTVDPATGDAYVPSHSLGQIPTDGQFDFGKLNGGVTGEGGSGGAFALVLNNVTGKAYPRLAVFPAPKAPGPCQYKVAFEARFVPDDPSNATVPPLGFGVGDSRGWPLTRSAIIIDEIGPDWKAFGETYHGLPDTTAIALQARLEPGTARISGRLEVRNLQVEAFSASTFPAYPLLTACAMLSEDGKALHLIVFNKSADQDISTRLHVTGFQAASSRVWEVNGSGFGAVDGVAETVHGDPLIGSVHIFPAHSMTAIDFVGQASPKSP